MIAMIMHSLVTRRAVAAGFVLALATILVGPAQAADKVGAAWLEGNVVHVSTNNIKINAKGKETSFLLVPHFKSVFSDDGKTTAQMNALRPGTLVKVYYDQKFLGARHADRIEIMRRGEMKTGQQKG